jgi:elongation factor P
MININDIKNGMTIVIDGNIYQIVEFQHVKPGKGPAFVRIKLHNIRTGANFEETFFTNIKFEKANIEKQSMQFLYRNGDTFNFMNMETYEQLELSKDKIVDKSNYLKESMDVELSFYKGELLEVILPDKVALKVVRAEPAVKGNTTSNVTKEVELETGLIVKVPMFISEGEEILVSTYDGKYDSRA